MEASASSKAPSVPTMPGNRPVKAVTEAVRERETFKYEPFLYTDLRYNDSGRPFDSAVVSTCSDPILTAFCQLGTFRTGTERAFISLFDTTHQLVLAEATNRTPLIPSLPSDACPEPLSLCGQAIPRSHGTCEHVLYITGGPKFDPDRVDDAPATLPLSFVRNLATDSRFTSKPYCQFGEGGQFYAAVPIRTRRGINIGSYCVFSSTKMEAWNDHHTDCMREISHAITEHFEAKRAKHDYHRSELIKRGLGSFVEGKSTIYGWQPGSSSTASTDNYNSQGVLNTTQPSSTQPREENNQVERPNGIDGTASIGSTRPSEKLQKARHTHTASGIGQAEDSHSEEGGISLIFSKSANIIREVFEVTGCLFYDVTLGSYRTPLISRTHKEERKDETASQLSSTSSSDEQLPVSSPEEPEATCDLLGFSTTDAASIAGAKSSKEGVIAKRFLARLLRRYPHGKIFNFDAIGDLQSSDSSDDDQAPQTTGDKALGGEVLTRGQRSHSHGQFSRYNEAALILQAFPGARSVAFVPVWDSRRERWVAGGFVYTLTPTRVLTNDGELSFLKAFAKLIGTEIHNIETRQSDKAKSDALGSLSHELRSPLHGVILGTELLNDTDLDVTQSNAAHTIEMCCRTLLDTIDHLLDYSKVNSFATKRKQGSQTVSSRSGTRRSDHFGKKTLYSVVRLDGLVEEVTESMFAGYSFQQMSVRQLSKRNDARHTDAIALHRLDSAQALEQLSPYVDGEGKQRLDSGNTVVCISIEPGYKWNFNIPAGAIRRIVMNLVGNSLKYTSRGIIRISLSTVPNSSKCVKLVVQDTGCGIGEDYLRHKLFKPFAQEDELAPGTGLGLSLVKSLVSNLGGLITVDSNVGVGTTVTVMLPLEQESQASVVSDDDKAFDEQLRKLNKLQVQLSGFNLRSGRIELADERTMIEDICQRSLQLEVVSEEEGQKKPPDVVLWSSDSFPESLEHISPSQLARSPNVVICQNALEAYKRSTTQMYADQRSIIEFISQPIGPRKLAKSIHLARKRWEATPELALSSPPAAILNHSTSVDRMRLTTGAAITEEAPSLSCMVDPKAEIPVQLMTESVSTVQTKPSPLNEQHQRSEVGTNAGRMLLVDDNHINLKILVAYMRKVSREYVAVVNGKLAVEAYTQNPGAFAGILMDISMPVMDGLEATRQIRDFERKSSRSSVPILALTGLASERAQREALESGMDVFLIKPVRLKELNKAMELMNITSLS